MTTTHVSATTDRRPRGVPALVLAPFEGRTWRMYLHILTSLPLAVLGFSVTVTLFSAGAGLLVTLLGVPVLAVGLGFCRMLGHVERGRARALLDVDTATPAPVRSAQQRPGFLARNGAMLRDGTSWRHALYAVLHFPWALLTFIATVVFWSVGWTALLYPAWQWVYPRFMDMPGMQIWGDGQGHARYLETTPEIWTVAGAGLLLVLVTPWLGRALTRVEALLVTGLLGPSPRERADRPASS